MCALLHLHRAGDGEGGDNDVDGNGGVIRMLLLYPYIILTNAQSKQMSGEYESSFLQVEKKLSNLFKKRLSNLLKGTGLLSGKAKI